jgi:hypothetical protein
MRMQFAKAAATAACLALAACSESKLEQCPTASSLVDTAIDPVWQGNPPNYVYFVQITKAKRDCDIDKYTKSVTSSVDISFRAWRRPGQAATYRVPIYVATTTEGRIIKKDVYSVQFSFEAGQAATEFTQSVNAIPLKVEQDKRAADYGILVGFQLTRAQLDYNRRAGRYAK